MGGAFTQWEGGGSIGWDCKEVGRAYKKLGLSEGLSVIWSQYLGF